MKNDNIDGEVFYVRMVTQSHQQAPKKEPQPLSADMLSFIDKLVTPTPAKPNTAAKPIVKPAAPKASIFASVKASVEEILTPAALAWKRYLNNK